ncbi:MAG TPA: NAD-dependent epimerase/dehydratase family protein [Actinomycetota bacterium]
MTTFFLTGGSGFVGNRLIGLLRSRGDAVYALARSDAAAGAVARAGGEPVRGALEDPAALRDGMRGADVVVHAGARTEDWGRPAEFERVNVEGTKNVLWAMERAGVARIVHVTPATVLADGHPVVGADETAPLPARPLGWYHRSKRDAELAVLAAERLEAIVVRPALVWGPGDTTWLPRFREGVRTGRFRWVGSGRHRVSTTHVANAAHGLALAADRGRAGDVYFVTDGAPVEFRRFASRYLRAIGLTVPDRTISPRGARLTASAGEGFWSMLAAKRPPPVTRAMFAVIGAECTVNDAKARSELGYEPLVPYEAGMQELERRRRNRVPN